MYVTLWTSAGAIRVALPNNATVEDLKTVLVENLGYEPSRLEISYGGRYVRDDVLVARFPPETLVAEGPRYSQAEMARRRQMAAAAQQQRLRQQQEHEAMLERRRREEEEAERARRAMMAQRQREEQIRRAQQEAAATAAARQRYVDPRAGNDDEDGDDDDQDDDRRPNGMYDPFFHAFSPFGLFGGAPRPCSRATAQQRQQQYQEEQRRAAQQHERERAFKARQQQLRKTQQKAEAEEERARQEAVVKKMEAARAKLHLQQEMIRKQQEDLAAAERGLLARMEEESRRLAEKEAAVKAAANAAAAYDDDDDDDNAEEESAYDSDDANDDAPIPTTAATSAPMTREQSAVIVTPHLCRVGLDEALHRPREEQPSPATSTATTPRGRPTFDDANAATDDADDNAESDGFHTVASTPSRNQKEAAPTANATSSSSSRRPMEPAGPTSSDEDSAHGDEEATAPRISITANIAELDGKAVVVEVPADATVAEFIAALKSVEPEVTRQGVRLMFCEKYVKNESEPIRAVPLIDGSCVDVCTGRYLSENEMTLYLADRKLQGVRSAIAAAPQPIGRNMIAYWGEQLMKALMQLDSLQDVPEDIRLRRKKGVKECMAEQDRLEAMA